MAYVPPQSIGATHAKISDAKQHLQRFSYGKQLIADDRSDTYTENFGKALVQFANNINGQVDKKLRRGPRITGPNAAGLIPFDWTVQDQMGLVAASSPTPPPQWRNIWFYSAPGSGASWWVGPSFEVGKWCADVLKLNHQPIGFPMGGYLGLLGGDAGLSYNEVIEGEYLELKRLLDTNEHVQKALADVKAGKPTDIEFWFSGYSQSADGMEDALVKLFGDGGPYEKLRDRINGTLQFGNPSKDKTGIARKKRPAWLLAKTNNITTKGDFYAEAPDEIRPIFYAEIVTAETSLSFAGHVLKIALPIIMNFFGGLFGLSGVGSLLSGGALGAAKADADAHDHEEVDDAIIELLSIKGVLTNIPALIQLVLALPGIQTHGEYHLIKPEFGGKTGIQVACDTVARFRR